MPTKKKAPSTRAKTSTPKTTRAKFQVSGGQNIFTVGTKSGQLVNEKAALGLSALWCGIRVISQDVGCLEPLVYRERKSGTRIRDREHPLNNLFRYPNGEMTGIVFRECLQSHAILQTGGFAEIVRRGDGTPAELWPIHPSFIQMYRDVDTGAFSYKVTVSTMGGPPGSPGKLIELPAENVFYVPGLTPDGSVAYSLLNLARETFGFGIAASAYGQAVFRNGARPSGALETPNRLSDTARQNLKLSFEKGYAGADNAGALMLLEEGLKFTKQSFSNEQTQYSELLNWFVYEVARLLVIPPSKLMSLEKATWGNLTELNRDYLNTTLRPWLEKWEAEIERRLLLPSEQGNVFIEFDVSKLLRADQSTRYTTYGLALANKQWRTVNEIRAEENLPPLDGQDEIGEPEPPAPEAPVQPAGEQPGPQPAQPQPDVQPDEQAPEEPNE